MSNLRCSSTTLLASVLLAFAPGAAESQTGHPAYLHLSDIHLDLSGTSSDTDPQLWAITKSKLASVLAGPDAPAFVLYTGDLPGHYDCTQTDCALDASQVPSHNANIRTVLSDLHDLVAGTAIPLLYLPGNNDSLAGDYFSFTEKDSTSWGDRQYRFSTRFGCAGETILGCLTGDRYNDTAAIDAVWTSSSP